MEENGRNGNSSKPVGLPKRVNNFGFFSETAWTMEGARVAAQVRLRHLDRGGRKDPDTEELLKRTKALEDFVDGKLKSYVLEHPTAKWWRRIQGMKLATIAKVIGEIENFGRYYKKGDLMIPNFVTRVTEVDEEGTEWIWVEGIERLQTPSALRFFAGLTPNQKREAGVLLDFNLNLKVAAYRLFQYSILFGGGKYFEFYQNYKSRKRSELELAGVKINPTPRGRFCPKCAVEMKVPKDTRFCPTCNTKLALKNEPEGILFLGHLDAMARRKAIVLFLDHLWLVWREALGLPVTRPYVLTHPEVCGEHTTYISPWDMVDLSEGEMAFQKKEEPVSS